MTAAGEIRETRYSHPAGGSSAFYWVFLKIMNCCRVENS